MGPTEVGCTQRKQAGGMAEQSYQGFGQGEKPFPQEGCKKGGEWAAQRGIQGAVPSILLPDRAVPHWRNWSPIIHCILQSHSLSPSAMLTMGVLGSPSNCRGGHRKGSAEPPAVLELGKVQFLASWTGGGGPGSSQGSMW